MLPTTFWPNQLRLSAIPHSSCNRKAAVENIVYRGVSRLSRQQDWPELMLTKSQSCYLSPDLEKLDAKPYQHHLIAIRLSPISIVAQSIFVRHRTILARFVLHKRARKTNEIVVSSCHEAMIGTWAFRGCN